ncbi:hypothetical protein CLHUN_42200 [Ruminiclostridium hungatei]|uniref:Uncharacterized protein n=1 Tax=Ruminiclostridium hungatei TaxID=48256 RepID=A0A1V4SEH0_RUMHU|nr:hypothetical protein [Ruminiclostridium hungatei]OPX41906.1 hypothetical protein CLHUN_42200 [Ruminiclostridium hungatei]
MINKDKNIKSKLSTRIYEDKYFEKLNEWQEHQYDLGHYTGGNISPIISDPGRPSVLGWFFVISSLIFSVLILVVIFMHFDGESILPILTVALVVVGLSTIQFIAGVRLNGRNPSKYVSFE